MTQRVIKFRVWDKKNKRFHTEPFIGATISLWENELILEDGYELQQFTGLLDKSGIEIFEGDIVEYGHEFRYEVRYVVSEEYAGWSLMNKKGLKHPTGLVSGCEVIGNIYSNPELLK